MSNLPKVIRTVNSNGTYRYEREDGEVVTAKSKRLYTHASAYRRNKDEGRGRAEGDVIIFLHARADLALKGSPDANRGVPHRYTKLAGVIEIEGDE